MESKQKPSGKVGKISGGSNPKITNYKITNKEEARKKAALQGKFSQRITIAKQGRELFLNKDYTGAAKKYNEYLTVLAQAQDANDIYQLSPAKFDQKKDLTEMLLISQIYWELSRIYEMPPKLQKAFDQCIKQFVRFTVNQPYQVLNSEVLRKHIRKNKHKSRQIGALQKAYAQIQVQSKKCFIATFALGESHWATSELRFFKKDYLAGTGGSLLTGFYYKASQPLVEYLYKRPALGRAVRFVSIPAIVSMAWASRIIRMTKKCICYLKS